MAHEQSKCKHLTINIYRDYETGAIKKEANCTNCLKIMILNNNQIVSLLMNDEQNKLICTKCNECVKKCECPKEEIVWD